MPQTERIPVADLPEIFNPKAFKNGTVPILASSSEDEPGSVLALIEGEDGEPRYFIADYVDEGNISADLFIMMLPYLKDPEARVCTLWFDVMHRIIEAQTREEAEAVMEGLADLKDDPTAQSANIAVRVTKEGGLQVYSITYTVEDDGSSKFDDHAVRLFDGNILDVLGDSPDLTGGFVDTIVHVLSVQDEAFGRLHKLLATPDGFDLDREEDQLVYALALVKNVTHLFKLTKTVLARYDDAVVRLIEHNMAHGER